MCRTKYLVVLIVAATLFLVLGVVAMLYRPPEASFDVSFDTETIPEQAAVVVNAVEKDVTVRDRLKARLAQSDDSYVPEVSNEIENHEDGAEDEMVDETVELEIAEEEEPVDVGSDECAEGGCVSSAIEQPIENILIGIAEDGKPRFTQIENGVPVMSTEVDSCLGHTHEILWEGVVVSLYHYHEIADAAPAPECFPAFTSTETQ